MVGYYFSEVGVKQERQYVPYPRVLRRLLQIEQGGQTVVELTETQARATVGIEQVDAIVVGSGISGGWAAKELAEKGLKVLMLERGKPLTHGRDYVGEHQPQWQRPNMGMRPRELYDQEYEVQSTSYAFDETTRHFWNNDQENPYDFDPDEPFHWMRADVVGGRSLLWARQSYRWSDLDFEANKLDGAGIDWPIRYRDIAPWYAHVERFIGVSGEKLGLSHSAGWRVSKTHANERCRRLRCEKDRSAFSRSSDDDRPNGHLNGAFARTCSVSLLWAMSSGLHAGVVLQLFKQHAACGPSDR